VEGKRVLIIDDAPVNRLILNEYLTQWGAAVTEAEDGPEGIKAFRAASEAGKPFDLVLMDFRMPGMDGLTVVEELNRGNGLRAIVMLLTSDDRGQITERAHATGVKHLLVKPLKRTELWRMLARGLSETPLPAKQVSSVAAAPAPDSDTPRRVLLVDDSEDKRLLVTLYLKKQPYQITTAENGQEALQAFREGRFDIVLMDMQMPIMDGYLATRAIRELEADENRPHTPILALTAYALPEEAKRSYDAGCDDHVTKPITRKVLLERINRALAAPAQRKAA
jgi:CheY-like chemotaxis protein